MTRLVPVLLTAFVVAAAGRANAQDPTPRPGTVEVTVAPGGATFFTSGDATPSFGNYSLGAGVAYNITRVIGIEGEFGSTLGRAQDLEVAGVATNQKTPNTVNYAANLVVAAPTRSSVVPYVAGGIGGLTLLERAEVGVNSSQTFLTGDVGGGLKWYAPSGRWGIRGDYRFVAVKSQDDAPAFFGQETRYGHRVYGGVVINAGR